MRIVVTGAAGFIGSHTCQRLKTRGHEVIGVDSFDGYLYPAEVKRRNAAETGVRIVESDICDRDGIGRVITPDVGRSSVT